MTRPTIAGIHLEHVTVGGNLTISGVTIQLPPQPPLWVNLPRLPIYLFGRDTLVDTLVQRLCNGRSPAVALHGLPGVGKSTLAAVLAYHPSVLAHFTDGVLWAGLGPQGDAMSALTAWGAALGVDVTDQPTPQQRSQAVRNAIGQKRLLLVIDDAWQVEPAQVLACGGPQALPLRRQVGDRWGESLTRYNMAMVCRDLDDLASAEEQLRQVVAFDEAIGHPDLASDSAALARIQGLRRAAAKR